MNGRGTDNTPAPGDILPYTPIYPSVSCFLSSINPENTKNTDQPLLPISPTAVDSCANVLIFKDKHLFKTFIPIKSKVTSSGGKGKEMISTGRGTVVIPMSSDGKKVNLLFPNAKYSADVPCNIVPTNALESMGYYFVSLGGRNGAVFKETSLSPNQQDPLLFRCKKQFGLHFLPVLGHPEQYSKGLTALLTSRYRKFIPRKELTKEQEDALNIIKATMRNTLDESTKALHDRLGHPSLERIK